jgi:hypothetical protein
VVRVVGLVEVDEGGVRERLDGAACPWTQWGRGPGPDRDASRNPLGGNLAALNMTCRWRPRLQGDHGSGCWRVGQRVGSGGGEREMCSGQFLLQARVGPRKLHQRSVALNRPPEAPLEVYPAGTPEIGLKYTNFGA